MWQQQEGLRALQTNLRAPCYSLFNACGVCPCCPCLPMSLQAQAPHVRMWAACMHLDYAQVGAVFAQKGQAPDKEKQNKQDLVSFDGGWLPGCCQLRIVREPHCSSLATLCGPHIAGVAAAWCCGTWNGSGCTMHWKPKIWTVCRCRRHQGLLSICRVLATGPAFLLVSIGN